MNQLVTKTEHACVQKRLILKSCDFPTFLRLFWTRNWRDKILFKAYVGHGPPTVRIIFRCEKGRLLASLGTNRESLSPQEIKAWSVRYFYGVDGSVYASNDLANKTEGARPQENEVLVAEIVRYPDGAASVSSENQAKTLVKLFLWVADPFQSVLVVELEEAGL